MVAPIKMNITMRNENTVKVPHPNIATFMLDSFFLPFYHIF